MLGAVPEALQACALRVERAGVQVRRDLAVGEGARLQILGAVMGGGEGLTPPENPRELR